MTEPCSLGRSGSAYQPPVFFLGRGGPVQRAKQTGPPHMAIKEETGLDARSASTAGGPTPLEGPSGDPRPGLARRRRHVGLQAHQLLAGRPDPGTWRGLGPAGGSMSHNGPYRNMAPPAWSSRDATSRDPGRPGLTGRNPPAFQPPSEC